MSNSSFYSVIQYSETPERGEFVNVGLVLFAGRPPAIVRMTESLRRVHKVFGPSAGADIRFQLKAIESRIYSSFSGPLERSFIDRFISMRTGNVRLSPARAIFADDPTSVIDSLYARFVSDQEPFVRRPKVTRELTSQFILNGVADLLEKPQPVELPQKVILRADYGYQNSAYNYIKAISLRSDEDIALQAAGRQAIVGSWLRKSSDNAMMKKLVVVADAKGKNQSFVRGVEELMHNNGVDFYTMNEIDRLSDHIKQHINDNPRLLASNSWQ
jgi:hypothetical protein